MNVNVDQFDVRFGSISQLELPETKIRPNAGADGFTEEELERYDQLRRRGYQNEMPRFILVDHYRILVNKINLSTLEKLMVTCCEEFLYPTVVTWEELLSLRTSLKQDMRPFRFLSLDQLLFWELDELEKNLEALDYPEMDVLNLLNRALMLRSELPDSDR